MKFEAKYIESFQICSDLYPLRNNTLELLTLQIHGVPQGMVLSLEGGKNEKNEQANEYQLSFPTTLLSSKYDRRPTNLLVQQVY